jgi:hypothetical protein
MQSQQVYMPEFIDAMSTNLVLSKTMASKRSSETKGSMEEEELRHQGQQCCNCSLMEA